MEKNLDLTTFDFVEKAIEYDDRTIPELLEEAELRGFKFMDNKNPYMNLFSQLFYNGGTIQFKQGIDPKFKDTCFKYLQFYMGGWSSKHEHKSIICAMLLSEIAKAPGHVKIN